MSNQKQENTEGKRFQVRGFQDIPREERATEAGDDEAAKTELGEDAATRGPRPASWRVAESLLTLRNQINATAPGRDRASDGTIGDLDHENRNSDHNPWVIDGNVGVVTAMDITHDQAGGCDANAIAEAIRGSQDERVKYIIWNKKIANSSPIAGRPAWEWRTYTGVNPHDKHVHISVQPLKAQYDSTKAWIIG